MKVSLHSMLACPRCYGSFDLHEQSGIDDESGGGRIVVEGTLACKACAAEYPVHQSVAAPAVIDHSWSETLNEMIARRVARRARDAGDCTHEGREQVYEEMSQSVQDVTDHAFADVLDEMDFSASPFVLDVGAAQANTTNAFVERGARAVALDTELVNLFDINFKAIDGLLEQEVHENAQGQRDYRKCPNPFPTYFSRVFSPAHRLPFRSGVFDITFCRATAHHLGHLRLALREMLRVTRPGGQLVLCSEPCRGLLDSESSLLESDIDRQRGGNERRPLLLSYLWPLRRYLSGLRVQYASWALGRRTAKMLNRLHYDYGRHLRNGEWVSGWRVQKLHLASCVINLIAQRNDTPIPPPIPASLGVPNFPPDDLVRLYSIQRPLSEIFEKMADDTVRVVRLRRQVLAGAPPRGERLDMGRVRSHRLSRGFTEPLRIEGRTLRATLEEASLTLTRLPRHNRVQMFLTPLCAGRRHRISVSVNETECGTFQIGEPGLIAVNIDDVGESIIDVSISNADLFRERVGVNDIEVGVGVVWIGLASER